MAEPIIFHIDVNSAFLSWEACRRIRESEDSVDLRTIPSAVGGSEEQRGRITTYAQALGRAFQVRDDMLDEISTAEELGKPIGSDRANEKSTFLTALGLERCRELVDELTNTAIRALDGFEAPDFLIWLAEEMARRGN